jgi:hypothetical protein
VSWFLQGPFPLDLSSIQSSTRVALDAAEAALRAGLEVLVENDASPGNAPGLYIVWTTEPRYLVAGFWVVVGANWLESEDRPGERAPPFVQELLDAATEEVWWQNLEVHPREGNTWRPVVVVEWPPELSARSALPPPGVPARDIEAPEDAHEDDGDWLMPDAVRPRTAAVEEALTEDVGADDAPPLPARRSLLTVTRGELTRERSVHRGRFFMVNPDQLRPMAGAEMIPVWAWLQELSGLPDEHSEEERHYRGPPLELFGGRVGFPISGWLSPSLELRPGRPTDVIAGTLRDRDVGSQLRSYIRQAFGITGSILLSVVALAVLVYIAALPRPEAAPGVAIPEPQPAMSVCSAHHQPFVEELRCQIQAYTAEGSPDGPVCGDKGSRQSVMPTPDDLQADFCGLYDRRIDGWLSPDTGAGFAQEVAAQACFNVLGNPYAYSYGPNRYETREMADPASFLEASGLKLRALEELVQDLVGACDTYRNRTEHQVEGAIFAAHIGAPATRAAPALGGRERDRERESEPSALRELLAGHATSGMPDAIKRCFEAGIDEGPLAARRYADLCGGPDTSDRANDEKKGWEVLAAEEETGDLALIERYTRARFGEGRFLRAQNAPPLWECHLNLDGELQDPDMPRFVETTWDLTVPVPLRYGHAEARVTSQLVLDAALTAFEEDGTGPLTCWRVVDRRLARYTQAHPLLGAPEEGWPSVEQQLCGQVCAGRYRVRELDDQRPWVTPDTDLALCTTAEPPPTEEGILESIGEGQLDLLRLPWSGDRGWVPPGPDGICAFNLVAQSYFADAPEPILVDDSEPRVWAGEILSGSRIAGGVAAERERSDAAGAAATSADRLSRVGRARSLSTCGYVATQCFGELMMSVTGDRSLEPYQWLRTWNRKIDWLTGAKSRELDGLPWCQLVQPYLRDDLELPEGELDYPCAKGVLDTKQAMESALADLIDSGTGEVAP